MYLYTGTPYPQHQTDRLAISRFTLQGCDKENVMKVYFDARIPARPPTVRDLEVRDGDRGTMSPYFAWFKHLRTLLAMMHVFHRNGLPAVRSYVRFDTSTAALAVPGIEPAAMLPVSSGPDPVAGLWVAEIQLLSTTGLTEGVQPILSKRILHTRDFYGQDEKPTDAKIYAAVLEATRHLTHEVFMWPKDKENDVYDAVLHLIEASTTRQG